MEQQDLVALITAAVTQATAGLVQQVQDLQQQVQQANVAVDAIANGEGKQEEQPAIAPHPAPQHGSSCRVNTALQRTLSKPRFTDADQFAVFEMKFLNHLRCFDAAELEDGVEGICHTGLQ